MGQWVCVTVIAQINTCSSSGAHRPKTLLAWSAVFLGQETFKCWPLLIKGHNLEGTSSHRAYWVSTVFCTKKKKSDVPDASNGLRRHAAPTVLLFTWFSDSLKNKCCILLSSVFWTSLINGEQWRESFPRSLCKCHFQSEIKRKSSSIHGNSCHQRSSFFDCRKWAAPEGIRYPRVDGLCAVGMDWGRAQLQLRLVSVV